MIDGGSGVGGMLKNCRRMLEYKYLNSMSSSIKGAEFVKRNPTGWKSKKQIYGGRRWSWVGKKRKKKSEFGI